jgi:O-antigen ligase
VTFRADQVILDMYVRLGPVWVLVALAIFAFACVAPLLRSVVAAVFLLVGTQVWFAPIHVISRSLRWYVLGVLAVRGAIYMVQAARPAGERATARNLVIALSLLALASTLWAEDGQFAFSLAGSYALGMVLTFGVLWRLLDQQDVMSVFARAVTIFSFVIFLTGFVVAGLAEVTNSARFLGATGFDTTRIGVRYSGVFYNPNMAGILGATVLPIVLATPRDYMRGVANIRWITVVLIALTIFMSGSRSAILGSVFAGVVLLLYRYGAGAFLTMIVGGVGVAALILYAPVEELDETSVGHITRLDRLSTLSGRLELWETGWAAAQDSLIFGRGWGENRVLEGSLYSKQDALEQGGVRLGTNLHNAHLQLLVDLGLVGLALFWGFCICVLSAGWRLLRGRRTARSSLTVVVFASVVAMMADTVVHGWVFSTGSPSTLVFWGFCAMVLKEDDRTRAIEAGHAAPLSEPRLDALGMAAS